MARAYPVGVVYRATASRRGRLSGGERDKIIAAQPFCDFPLHTPWGVRRATLFLDVATHPEHRRQGLFRRVVAAARTAAFERGACLAMTTPNRTAFQGFQRMPEWGRLCTLDCLLVPIGAGARTHGAGSIVLGARLGFAVASVFWHGPPPGAPGRVSALYRRIPVGAWDGSGSVMASRGCRGRHYGAARLRLLHWRFDAGCRLFLAQATHGPVGYAAARLITRAGLKLGMLLDCVTAGDGANAVPLLAAVLAWLQEQVPRLRWDILCDTVRRGIKPAPLGLSVYPARWSHVTIPSVSACGLTILIAPNC